MLYSNIPIKIINKPNIQKSSVNKLLNKIIII